MIVVVVALVAALVVQQWVHAGERATWAQERRDLIHRVIARHAGEVVALDTAAERTSATPHEPEITPEGL